MVVGLNRIYKKYVFYLNYSKPTLLEASYLLDDVSAKVSRLHKCRNFNFKFNRNGLKKD